MKKKRMAALLAVLAITLPMLFASCRENGGDGKDTDVSSGSVSGSESGADTNETDKLPNGIPDKTYNGTSIRMITAAESGNGIDVGITMDEAVDKITEAVYKRDRAVENLLDVKLNVRTYESYPEAFNALKTSVDASSDDYDVAFLRTDQAFSLAGEEKLYDLSKYGCIDLSAPWWDSQVNEKHMINGKLYLAVGSASVNDLLRTHMFLFNSNLFDDKKIDYPYDDVSEGTWTIDKLAQYAATLNDDVNGDTVMTMDSSDIFGFSSYSWTSAYTLWYGCGGNVIGQDDEGYPVVDIDEDKTVKIYEKLYQAIVSSGSNYVSDGNQYVDLYNSFTEGRVFVTEACMMHLTHWETFSDMKDDYGIIPSPKLDETQAEYISYAEVVEPAVCVPITASASEEMLSAVIEALAYEGYYTITPAGYETSLKGRFARDEQSKEMLDIISQNRTSCLALVFIPNTSIVTSVPVLLQNGTEEIASVIAAFRSAMEAGLADAVNKFRS